MMSTVEVDADPPLGPAHVQPGDYQTVLIDHPYLRLRLGNPLRTNSSRVSDSYGDSDPPSTTASTAQLSGSADPRVARRDPRRHPAPWHRRVHQRASTRCTADVKSGTGGRVECGSGRRGDRHAAWRLHFTRHQLVDGRRSGWWPTAGVHQFGGRLEVDPLGAGTAEADTPAITPRQPDHSQAARARSTARSPRHRRPHPRKTAVWNRLSSRNVSTCASTPRPPRAAD